MPYKTADGTEVTPGIVANQLIASGFVPVDESPGILRRPDGAIAAIRGEGESKICSTMEEAMEWIAE